MTTTMPGRRDGTHHRKKHRCAGKQALMEDGSIHGNGAQPNRPSTRLFRVELRTPERLRRGYPTSCAIQRPPAPTRPLLMAGTTSSATREAISPVQATERVMASRDLLRCIFTYQDGIVETLRGVYCAKGVWFSTFSPRDFIPMHMGPFGRKREALLQCIVSDRVDLIKDFFRCFPTYAQDDIRFKEIIDAALMLNRVHASMVLQQHKPTYHCTPRVLRKAALRGHRPELLPNPCNASTMAAVWPIQTT
ncbi:hypothetical protein SDRG_15558 [Saprolegnia diclina VS20]|uniref:Uncharacterized protein n=1 Tax=Saprolegnia diclina (strain VS20) TaxID=1156394 RepID=T0R3I9_SAPDV|nr:hypothetical protein SDRG_15558 [Saprolegnia diclina VS20]EQC26618.1 hypothetical protein SDRG_15558 [Saprolegnia diclina VS20]|eukprot:XP_008619956.1 hypothetical protein SDRG_15558 [Saprolegnia diclina VS20]